MLIGKTIGPYRIVDKLGEGGMGEVYRARDIRLQRDVALKILPSLFVTDPDRRARFEREARVLASLNHPSIAAIDGIEEPADAGERTPVLVLELVEGETSGRKACSGAARSRRRARNCAADRRGTRGRSRQGASSIAI